MRRCILAGAQVKIQAAAKDPDKQAVNFTFWRYDEADTAGADKVEINNQGKGKALVTVPASVKKGETLHIIVEGRDTGSPAIIRYQRVILEVM